MALLVPKVWRISASIAPVWFTPETDCDWFEVIMQAGGGGGAGTDNSPTGFVQQAQYGKRGGDSWFHLRPGVQSMLAMAPDAMVCYVGGDYKLVPDQAVFLENIPAGTNLVSNKPYYVMNRAYDAPNNRTTFNLSETPYSPPFAVSVNPSFPNSEWPMIGAPVGTNQTVTIRPTWYGVQGGGGGGVVGDQGTPLGYWGLDEPGPEGYVQSYGEQRFAGDLGYRVGGGISAAYLTNGIDGINLVGSSGNGAAPGDPNAPWGGTSGAWGAFGHVFMRPQANNAPFFCWAGEGGKGGPVGTGGYKGGDGGHGCIAIIQYPA